MMRHLQQSSEPFTQHNLNHTFAHVSFIRYFLSFILVRKYFYNIRSIFIVLRS